ncbi:MAG: DUF2335 domain-containing protein [Acidithiobacillus sp.]
MSSTHPDMLRKYEELLPGTAQKMLEKAWEQGEHRQSLEKTTLEANIRAQQENLTLQKLQIQSARFSDTLSQFMGFVLGAFCIGGALYLFLHHNEWGGVALTSFPVAAVIRSFRAPAMPNAPEKKKGAGQ